MVFAAVLPAYAQTPETIVTARQLQDDFAIMKQAYQQLHPGLYRFTDKAMMDRHFDTLEG